MHTASVAYLIVVLYFFIILRGRGSVYIYIITLEICPETSVHGLTYFGYHANAIYT